MRAECLAGSPRKAARAATRFSTISQPSSLLTFAAVVARNRFMIRIPFPKTVSDRMRRLVAAALAWLGIILGVGAPAQIFVVNHGSGTIGKYDMSGATINASFISGLSSPTGIAFAGDFMYVAQGNGTVRKYTTAGTLANSALITGLYFPLGLAVSGVSLYVANGGGEEGVQPRRAEIG